MPTGPTRTQGQRGHSFLRNTIRLAIQLAQYARQDEELSGSWRVSQQPMKIGVDEADMADKAVDRVVDMIDTFGRVEGYSLER